MGDDDPGERQAADHIADQLAEFVEAVEERLDVPKGEDCGDD